MHLTSDKRAQEHITNIALACLVFTPYAISALLKTFLYPRPYWYFYYDPETWWYFGGLALAHGGKPVVITHPGGPLYLITAIISAAGSFGPLDFSRFKTIGYMAALPINFIGCLLVISTLRGHPLSAKLAAGLLLFLTPQIFEFNNVWSAELFFPAVAGICVAALLLTAPEKTSTKMAAFSSIVFGLAASHKLNFGVIGIVYAISLAVTALYFNSTARAIRLGSISVLCQILGFTVGTIPLITNLPQIVRWTFDVLLRQGYLNEQGAYGLPSATDIFTNIGMYVAGSKAYHILILFFVLSSFVGIWYKPKHARTSYIFLFGVAFSILAFSYVLAGKEGGPFKYFMPAAVGFVALFVLWTELMPKRFQRSITLTLILLAGGLVVKQGVQDFRTNLLRIEENRKTEAAIGDALQMAGCSHPDSVVVLSWRAPLEAVALRLNATWTWPLPAPYNEFLQKIETKFPNIGNINQFSNKHLWLPGNLHHWDCLVISDEVRQMISIPLERTKLVERVGEFSILRNEQ